MALPLPDNYLSRAPQEKARRAVELAVLAGEKAISFSMPTGTGKTRVLMAIVASLFLRCSFRRFILVLPNLNLLDQLKRGYIEKLGWAKKGGVFYVCSEPGTDATDEADFRRFFPAASDADLAKIYARKQVIIVTTYASLPKVLRDLPATRQPMDALILDEAHHEEGPVVLEALEAGAAKYKHKISASATLLPSHQPCYTYSTSAAIEDKVIKDYQLFICLMLAGSSTQSKKIFIEDIADKTGNRQVIAYTTYSDADRDGATSVRKLEAELGGDPELWVAGLTGAHTREQRQAVVDEFATPLKGAEKVKLLVNCRVFGEGADISAANGIVLDKTTTDPTQLQQNIGRALRKADGETVPPASIMFMIYVDAEELAKYPMGAERNAALVEQVYNSGAGKFAMVAIAGLLKQDPAKVREIMADNQRVAFTRAQPDRAVVPTVKETVRLTMPDGFEDDGEDLNGLADAIVMGTQMSAAEVQSILRGLTEDRSCEDSEDSDEDSSEDSSEDSDDSSSADSSNGSSEEQEPFVQRLSEQLGRNVVIHVPGEDMILASEPAGAYDETLELLKTPTGFDLVVPAADKDNERYKPKQRLRPPRPVNFMQEQELKELVSLGLSDDTDLTHGLTARLEVKLTAKTRAELESEQLTLFFKAVGANGDKALVAKARVDEEGVLVSKDADGWRVGLWFTHKKQVLKNPAKKAATYDMLTQDGTNKIVKEHLDKFLADQAKPAMWHHDLTNDGKLALYYKAVKLNDTKALAFHARVNKEGRLVAKGADGWDNAWPIGMWFGNKKTRMLKNPAKKAAAYASLTQDGTNEIVKAHLEKFLADKPAVWHDDLTHEDKLALFHKAVEFNAKALAFHARVDEEGQLVAKGADGWDDAWQIGKWFDFQKQKMKNPSKKPAVYDMLTQDGTNEIVKAHLEKFLAEQDQPEKFYEKFSNEQKLDLLLTAVKNISVKALVGSARVDEEGALVTKGEDGWGAAWPVGQWFDFQKQKMKDPTKKAATYAMLTQDGTNEIVKANLEKFFAEQDKKKRKASDGADDDVSEVYDDVATPAAAAAEPPKKRQKTTAAASAAPPTAVPAPPASRKRPAAAAAAALEEQEQQEEQPKPKRARKQPKPQLTYNELSEAAKDKIIQDHLARKQKQAAAPAGYRTTNPDEKDRINGVLARYVPPAATGEAAESEAKVIFLDHTEFKTAYALLETARVRPEHMLIPQLDPAVHAEMARHELFGPSVVQGDFNRVLEGFLAAGGVVRSVYADFCSTLQGDGLPFVQLLTKYRAQLAPAAVVGVTVTLRNPEGVRYSGYDISNMNMALWRLLERVPENLFHIDGVLPEDDGPYTYGAGQPMATWLIRGFFEKSLPKKD
jgi:superfamily II DNA or RNA helicase